MSFSERLFRFAILTFLISATIGSVYVGHASGAALFGMLFGTAMERLISAPTQSLNRD